MSYTAGTEVNLSEYPTLQTLVTRCRDFFAEVESLTPGSALEAHLNSTFGPGHPLYDDCATCIRRGLADSEAWISGPSTEVDGPGTADVRSAFPVPETDSSASPLYISIARTNKPTHQTRFSQANTTSILTGRSTVSFRSMLRRS